MSVAHKTLPHQLQSEINAVSLMPMVFHSRGRVVPLPPPLPPGVSLCMKSNFIKLVVTTLRFWSTKSVIQTHRFTGPRSSTDVESRLLGLVDHTVSLDNFRRQASDRSVEDRPCLRVAEGRIGLGVGPRRLDSR